MSSSCDLLFASASAAELADERVERAGSRAASSSWSSESNGRVSPRGWSGSGSTIRTSSRSIRFATRAPSLRRGWPAYRDAVGARRSSDAFAVRYAHERLAILGRDVDAVVRLLGGNLTTPYQFVRVTDAMCELGLDDEVLAWAKRGIAQTSGWQVSQLYDLACAVHDARGEPLEVLVLRRAQHERIPSSATYRALRAAADALDA